ncbi:MAG: RDD family protein [Acidobacteriota bacterium]
MKCPKCGYLGFEPVERCRNCGYDFSLSSTPPPAGLDFPLKTRETGSGVGLDEVVLERAADLSPRPMRAPAGELPLFDDRAAEDLPLIVKPSAPRTPLAVRRATPEVPRMRATPARLPTFELPNDAAPSAAVEARSARLRGEGRTFPLSAGTMVGGGLDAEARRGDASASDASAMDAGAKDASIASRSVALLVDLVLLAAIDAVALYFMFQICGIGLAEAASVPRAPLLAFFLVQNGGYFLAFTAAGGQTLGKMATGIKVVSADPSLPFDPGRAAVRELVWLVLALPAGLGLLTALAPAHRGIHDRCAGTRVVRVPS